MKPTTTTYRTYWGIWVVLLALTLAMIGIEAATLSPLVTVLILSAAMMTKATLIAGWFMHLRWETMALMLIVVCSILITAAFMFFLLSPDALAA